jgi:sugar phosphate isomerase/epimerase
MDNLIVSTASNPDMPFEEVVAAYARVGYRKFEGYCTWTSSAFDIEKDPAYYLDIGRRCGMTFASVQLPTINDNFDASLVRSIRAARFARAIGASVVVYRASSRPNHIRAARPFLDAIDGLGVTPVLQNHCQTSIKTLDEYREVIDGISDPRMKTLLEVGHFHSAGIHWRDACNLLAGSIALVHLKDQVGEQGVPFGAGEIDLPGLFAHLCKTGYAGDYVVEMEVQDKENTLRYLAAAREFIRTRCLGNT